nr:Os03g0170450 [Ipomoea batatas]
MQKSKAPGSTNSNFDSRSPIKGLWPSCEEMILQAAFRHELIHQKSIFPFSAVTNKFNQVRMMKLPEIINFSLPLLVTLKTFGL